MILIVSAVRRADRQVVNVAQVVGDRVVHLVAADPDRAVHGDPSERDHGHLACAAADVDHHPPDRFFDREPRADRGRDRLLDQVHAPGPGRQRRLLDGALLDRGHPRGGAHDQAWMRVAAVDHPADEVAQHLLGDLEVGDHAVAQRARGGDRRGRAADHPLGLGADRVNQPGLGVRGDDRRLGDHDPPARDVHERVRGPEVDRHVVHAEAGRQVATRGVLLEAVSTVEDAHKGARNGAFSRGSPPERHISSLSWWASTDYASGRRATRMSTRPARNGTPSASSRRR